MGDGERNQRQRARLSIAMSAALWVMAVAVLVGFVAGVALNDDAAVRAATNEPGATATRAAEIEELNRLRTQVASPSACTPAPTPTPANTPTPEPTPTPVPPVSMGHTMTYAGNWTVVVKSFSSAPSSGAAKPKGKLVQVNVTVTNDSGSVRTFPFSDWTLLDSAGRTFALATDATTTLFGPAWYRGVAPTLPVDFAVVFDVAIDAGPSFILQSQTDPTFRVAVAVQERG